MPKPRPRPWLWILLLVPLAIVAGVGVIFSLGALFNLTGKEVELGPGERELVLDISHLTGWMEDYIPNLKGEKVVKRRYVDDSYEIEYVYDLPDDDDAPYLSYSLTFEPSESDASTTYVSLWGGTKIGFYVSGEVEVKVREDNDLLRWGDESRFGVLFADGQPFGNVFVAKKGKRVVYLIVSGIYFDDAETVSGFLVPYLEKLDAYAFDT
ncbi:MAG: hypothetical protein ACRD21_12175 [Vicinamibacteria bacterium]